MKALSSAERRALRARAHALNPVVAIGNGGLTPGVMAEVERSLKAHELIKIRVGGMEHAERESACEAICGQTGAAQVQHIGKVLVVYRKRPKEATATATRKPRKKTAKPQDHIGNYSFSRPALSRKTTSRKFSDNRTGGARRARG